MLMPNKYMKCNAKIKEARSMYILKRNEASENNSQENIYIHRERQLLKYNEIKEKRNSPWR